MTPESGSTRPGSAESAPPPTNRLQGKFAAEPPPAPPIDSLRTGASDLVRHGRFIGEVVILATLLAVLVALLLPNQYTSTATLLPSGKGGNLSSLARGLSGQLADLGITGVIPGGDPGESSELFPDILKSRTVGEAVLQRSYMRSSTSGEQPFDLYEYFDGDYAFESLYEHTLIRQEPKTGIIALAVTTPYPELSQQIAAAFLAELETFNRERRRTQGMEKAAFLESRLLEVKSELETAEDELKTFRSRNMNFAQSSDPEILAQLSRLERMSRIKAEVYALLTQQHELARLEIADQMPIVQVLDSPAVPNRKSGPPRRVIVVVTAMLSLVCACMISVGLRPARQLFPDSRLLERISRLASSPPRWIPIKLRRGPEEAGRSER